MGGFIVVIDSSKQQALDADAKAKEQINFTGNLENQSTVFFIIEEVKKNCFRFFTRNCKNILFPFFALI